MNILLDPDARPVIGHRGNRAYAPENTIESFAQAVAAGAEAIEFDVRVSADGIPVVHHDPTLMRTTDGHGEIARTSFDELRKLDAGANFTRDAGKTFPYRGKGHRIPKLDEVIEAFPTTPLLIEIKTALASVAVKNTIERHKVQARTLVDSFAGNALDVFHGSDIPYGSTPADVARLMREVLLHSRITPFDFKALCIPLSYRRLPLPVKRFAKVLPAHNCRVHVWTVNSPAVALDLWRAGVNGIISDDPALMLKTRARLPAAIERAALTEPS
ncbi:MAG TPA: glycerophosphodiester phosphodiesterase family protein [Gemmatimonadaceae bacterium]|nr:glycerophosphodiester phosphodiesterase family protein [Gemmatimonadaceae bacterium]